ncbi:MAG: F-box protein [Parachlamydiales bacterium]|nr:F-box protein [Parachlamydiales bacterium]
MSIRFANSINEANSNNNKDYNSNNNNDLADQKRAKVNIPVIIDSLTSLPPEIYLMIGTHLSNYQKLQCRLVCKLWASHFSDKSLWLDFTFANLIVKDDPLIQENPFEARLKNQRIIENIDSLNFVSRELFTCDSYPDCVDMNYLTVWNNKLVIGADCEEKYHYLIINDDQPYQQINYDKPDTIMCMTALNSQLFAGTFDGKIYQLSTDQSQKVEPTIIYDGNDQIVYIESFQDNLLILTKPDSVIHYFAILYLIKSNGEVIKSFTHAINNVQVFGNNILISSFTQLICLNSELEIMASNRICDRQINDLNILNDTIITLNDDYDLVFGTYKDYFDGVLPNKAAYNKIKQITTFNHRVLTLVSQTYSEGCDFSDTEEISEFYPVLHCYDIENNIEKSFKNLSTDIDIDQLTSFVVKQEKAYFFLGQKIVELNFGIK